MICDGQKLDLHSYAVGEPLEKIGPRFFIIQCTYTLRLCVPPCAQRMYNICDIPLLNASHQSMWEFYPDFIRHLASDPIALPPVPVVGTYDRFPECWYKDMGLFPQGYTRPGSAFPTYMYDRSHTCCTSRCTCWIHWSIPEGFVDSLEWVVVLERLAAEGMEEVDIFVEEMEGTVIDFVVGEGRAFDC